MLQAIGTTDTLKKFNPNGEQSELICDEEALCISNCKATNELPGDMHVVDGYDCPICKNKGVVYEPKKDERGNWIEQGYFCKCFKIRSSKRKLKRSGLQNIIDDNTFDKYKADEPWQKAIKAAALRFIEDKENTWFFIGGASGAGKTHICTAIAGHYLNMGKSVKYMLWRDDVVKLKASVNDSEAYEKIMSEFKTADVLYIDDLFKTGKNNEGMPQKPTGADINIAFELLNYRYNNPNMITLISSECRVTDILDIDESVGGRIAERTIQHGYGINIKPDRTKNYRLRGSVEL